MDVVFEGAEGFYPGSYGSNLRYNVFLTGIYIYNVIKIPSNFM
jgi:hypothetical protein